MKLKFSYIILFVIFVLTFLAGFFLTDLIFRTKKIPYPSEWFGVAAGVGLASAVQALIKILRFH